MNKDVMTWTCVPNAEYQTQEELNLFLQNPTFKEHYDAIIGQSTPMCVLPPEELEDSILPSDVPDMKLVASDLKAPEFHIGDLYVGTIDGRRCMGTMHNFAGLYVITAGEPE